MSEILLVAAIISVIWGIVSFIAIVSFLSQRGEKINFFLIRLWFFRYLKRYSEITTAESGRPGPWFYSCIVSLNLALVFGIAGIIARMN